MWWSVNGYDASFREFKDRGVSIHPVNSTTSRLIIVGNRINDHVRVQCVALLIDNNTHRVLDHAESDVAVLVVYAYGKCYTSV